VFIGVTIALALALQVSARICNCRPSHAIDQEAVMAGLAGGRRPAPHRARKSGVAQAGQVSATRGGDDPRHRAYDVTDFIA
jgi:hypothetical protein